MRAILRSRGSVVSSAGAAGAGASAVATACNCIREWGFNFFFTGESGQGGKLRLHFGRFRPISFGDSLVILWGVGGEWLFAVS